MCGIAGYMGKGTQGDLDRMIESIRHRGPDDAGFLVLGCMGLGHARLSILDLSPAGRNPMSNEDGTVHVSFNGEIYNFKELKESLRKKHTFKSATDTEVIVHLYEEEGENVFSKLQGMFAIALYDQKKETLFLARDRMGKKPLYYGIFEKTLVFASELKALFRHPVVKKEIDEGAVAKYLQYEYVPTPQTLFKNIFKLEPGTYLRCENGIVEKRKFWTPSFTTQELSYDEAIDRLDRVLEKAVERRMVADVPVGMFLSGGLDSSIIAHYAMQAATRPIHTYSIGFREKSFDEGDFSTRVARHLNTIHHTRLFTEDSAIESLSLLDEVIDEPVADVSFLPMLALSEEARKGVTVALSGDGADELFAGYQTFQADLPAQLIEKLPQAVLSGARKVTTLLPVKTGYFSFDFKIRKLLEGLMIDPRYRHSLWLGSFNPEDRQKILRGCNPQDEELFADIDRYRAEVVHADFLHQNLYLYMRTYMMDGVLVKVDRSTMRYGLEARSPFLDTDVVELANVLPYQYKVKGFTTKRILRDLAKKFLPSEIIQKKRHGFTIPLAEWLKCDFGKVILPEIIHGSKKHDLFDTATVERLVQEHVEGKMNHAKKLWTLYVFNRWYDQWFN